MGKATPFTNANRNIPIYLHASAVERAASKPFLAAGPLSALSQSSTTSGDASRSLFPPNRWGGGDALRSFFLRPCLGEANARAAPATTGLSMSTSTGREASHTSQESELSGLRNVHLTQRHSEAAGGVGGGREGEGEGMVGAWGMGRTREETEAEAAAELLKGKAWWLFRIRNGAELSMAREENGHGLTADLNPMLTPIGRIPLIVP